MATIMLKYEILVPQKQGMNLPYKMIECNGWHPSVMVDGIEVVIDDKNVTIPINNVIAIIE
jgi:hypothetical protein